jgi:glycosyltransferase involved in cell wall biosynthesis
MKVIQIMPEFGLAGAETMCENLCYELIKDGIDVKVISLYNFHSAITERMETAGIKIWYLGKKKGFDPTIFGKLYQILKKEKPDCIHTHRYVMRYAIPMAVLAGIKGKVHTVHNIAQKENTIKGIKINRILYKYYNVIPVALSKIIRDTITEVYDIPKRKIPVIFNGINLEHCIPKKEYSFGERIALIHIGRFQDVKNHRLLIDAFDELAKKYPNLYLQLIGDGELQGKLMEYASKLPSSEHIRFEGLKQNVYPYLSKADIFVLPSKYEGMPMTLIEAMGTGLPIVASRVGGIPDMIKDGEEGLLITPDKEHLVNAVDQLLTNEKLRSHLGKKALTRSRDFSSEIMAKKYEELYEIYSV